ncbi:UNVERIFIED_CONTAM: hypothetical protein O8I53_09750 [Campylobacter lari]
MQKRNLVLSIDSCYQKIDNNEPDVNIKHINIFNNERVLFFVNDNNKTFFNNGL